VSGPRQASGTGRARPHPALAAVLQAEPADREEGLLLHGPPPTTVVATPVPRQAAGCAEVATGDRHRSPGCPVAQRRLFSLARSGGQGTLPGSSLPPVSTRWRLELRADAPRLVDRLTGRALPLMVASVLFGVTWIVLGAQRRFTMVRVTAALARGRPAVGLGRRPGPYLLAERLTIEQAAAGRAVLQARLARLGVSALLRVPSLVWLFTMFHRGRDEPACGPSPAMRSSGPPWSRPSAGSPSTATRVQSPGRALLQGADGACDDEHRGDHGGD